MVEQLPVIVHRQRIVPLGDEVLAHVAQEEGSAPPVPAEPGCRADDGVVDRRRHRIEQSRGPHQHRAAAEVAEAAHRPVDVRVEVLEHVGLAVDDDPLEHRSGLAVGPLERPPLGRTGDEVVDRSGWLSMHEVGGHVSTSVGLRPRPIDGGQPGRNAR